MLHWFDPFRISPDSSQADSVNINYCSDVQIAIRPHDDAFVRWHHPAVRQQLDSCIYASHTYTVAGDSTHGDALCGHFD